MTLQYNSKFLVRPTPLDDEYILSYLGRLCFENGYESINLICTTIFGSRTSLINIARGDFNKTLFSQYTGLSFDKIENICITGDDSYVSVNISLCLKCFKEIGYVKKDWYIKDYICYKHYFPINSRCLYCNSLYLWSIINKPICNKCNRSIFHNLDFKLGIEISPSNVFNFYNNVLKIKSHPPNSVSYSVKYFSNKYNYTHDLIANKNDCFEIFLRQYLFNDNFYCRQVSQFVIDYIYFLVNIENIDLNVEFFKILEILNKFKISNIDNKILKDLKSELDFNYFISIEDINFRKYYFLNFENCKYIFFLDQDVIELLCEYKVIKCYMGNYIDIFSVFQLCVDIKLASTNFDLDIDFVYFKDLSKLDKIKILRNLRFGNFILYNFNTMKVFSDIKIHLNDLNYIDTVPYG